MTRLMEIHPALNIFIILAIYCQVGAAQPFTVSVRSNFSFGQFHAILRSVAFWQSFRPLNTGEFSVGWLQENF